MYTIEKQNDTFTLVKFDAPVNYSLGLQDYSRRQHNTCLSTDVLAPRDIFYGLYSNYTQAVDYVWDSIPNHDQIQKAMYDISDWLVGE